MSAIKIAENIYWVGAIDWNVRAFHGHTYTTQRGTSYNSYLVVDEKIALIDGVYRPFSKELIDNIKEVVDPSKIDYIIANHVETDHSGGLVDIKALCPNAKIYGTARCKEGLERYYYQNWDFQVVKTGDTLSLGKKTLNFIEAPMLHWPDTMFTYLPEEFILFSNDAFGQHFATNKIFDDEVDQCALMQEAAKYYANILWPLSTLVKKKIQEITSKNLSIKMIAPSHGVIWRKDPMKIVNAYMNWAESKTTKKVVCVYETMWGATEKLARKIVQGLTDAGVHAKLYDVANTDKTDIFADMLDAKGIIIGSSTHDNSMLPNIACFLHLLKGFKPKNRVGCAFGSFGWGGGAVKEIEEDLKKAGIQNIQQSLSVKFMPDVSELEKAYNFGKELSKNL